jgi:predicted GNAT superfamily acetyltransferase
MIVQFRDCNGCDELEACVQIQIATWGYDESDAIPRKTFLLAQKIGGQVIGVFEPGFRNGLATGTAGSLVGFAMSLPGVKSVGGRAVPYLHSHMLAVLESHRNRGLGAQLKWKQRDEALSRGIYHMEWTFDPLQIKNAFLNIHRLGAISREYRVNFYGVSSSRLQGGLPTDRLLAEWELDSPQVEGLLARRPAATHTITERISVPVDVENWKSEETTRGRALAIQLEIQEKFQQAFSLGLAVVGFSRDTEGNGVYELGQYTQLSLISRN